MTRIVTETVHAGGYILQELNRQFSRAIVTIKACQALMVPGTVIALTSGKWVMLNPGASDGSQTAAGVLFDSADASAGDVQAVAHIRQCVVSAAKLTWPVGISDIDKAAAI